MTGMRNRVEMRDRKESDQQNPSSEAHDTHM